MYGEMRWISETFFALMTEVLGPTSNNKKGGIVRKHLCRLVVALCVCALWFPSRAHAAKPPIWIDVSALMTDSHPTTGDPCDKEPNPPGEESLWGLKANESRFKLTKRNGDFHGFKRLEPINEDPDMEVPKFLVFNKKRPWLTASPCQNTVSLSTVPFAFAIHMLAEPNNPESPKTPHALLFVPVNLGSSDKNPTQFFMLVYSIQERSCDCPDDPLKPRCEALHELWKIHGLVKPKDFRQAISDRIDFIRPTIPVYANPFGEYHNGVIHGNL